ncbi:MAG TPA: response regulator [Ornithinibacter sp.]|nr:response regulator [Ornithinibacter sp.]
MSETTPAPVAPAAQPAPATKSAPAAKSAPAQPAATQRVPAQPAPVPKASTAKRVLVAEDEAIIRLDLAEMLVDAGYDVVGQAGDGEQAVALATSLRPDIVIMDVKMPVMDGITAAEQIGKERICPVVMLTAFSQTELVERARDAGVMAYIVKPFTSSDVTPAIDIALSRWAELKTLEAEVADLGDRLETRKAVDRAKGVLMTKLKISEADAFRWIQKTAMDRRMGMREVADAVVAGMEKA